MRVASEQDSGDVCRRLKKRGGKYFNKSQKRVICGQGKNSKDPSGSVLVCKVFVEIPAPTRPLCLSLSLIV